MSINKYAMNSMDKRTVAVLVTVYNRKEITLRGLSSLFASASALGEEYNIDVFLVDDGSTDGTYETVRAQYPHVHAYKENGSLYWTRGMQLAWEKAVEHADYDYFLWFNDDGELFAEALSMMFETAARNREACVVTGAFMGSDGEPTYVGMDRDEQSIVPDGTIRNVTIMFGNLVLIPREVYKAVGTMSKIYTHGGGDNDYGFRVQKKGYEILQTPVYIGVVDGHDEQPFLKERTFVDRWKGLHSPKFNPWPIFSYLYKYRGKWKAIRFIAGRYLHVIFPPRRTE